MLLGLATFLGAVGRIAGGQYTRGIPDRLVFLPINVWIAWLAVLVLKRSSGVPSAR